MATRAESTGKKTTRSGAPVLGRSAATGQLVLKPHGAGKGRTVSRGAVQAAIKTVLTQKK